MKKITISFWSVIIATLYMSAINVRPTHHYSPTIVPYLQKAVTALEKGEYYDWTNGCVCNVGIVAQQVTGKRWTYVSSELEKYNTPQYRQSFECGENCYSWSSYVDKYGDKKGTPGIIGEMQRAGFTLKDIENLENLSDSRVTDKIDGSLRPDDINSYYTYLKTWIKVINEENAPPLKQ